MLKGLCVCYVVVALSFFSVAISGYWAFGYQAAGLIFSNFVDDYSKPLAPKWLIYLPNICTIAQLLANGVVSNTLIPTIVYNINCMFRSRYSLCTPYISLENVH